MTMDKSLRVRRGLIRSRGVLTRAERITRLQEADRWKEDQSALGLPKVRVYKLTVKKKKKKKEEEGAEKARAAALLRAARLPNLAGKGQTSLRFASIPRSGLENCRSLAGSFVQVALVSALGGNGGFDCSGRRAQKQLFRCRLTALNDLVNANSSVRVASQLPNPVFPPARASIFATRSTCPKWYCGIDCDQRATVAKIGAPLVPNSSAISSDAIFSSSTSVPLKKFRLTCPADENPQKHSDRPARIGPGNFWLEKLAERIRRPLDRGHDKTEAVEWMSDLTARIGKRDDRRAGVWNRR